MSAGNLRVDTHLGVGVNPAATHSPVYRALQVGSSGGVLGYAGTDASVVYLAGNTFYDGTNERALIARPGVRLDLVDGQVLVKTAPSVAAGRCRPSPPTWPWARPGR